MQYDKADQQNCPRRVVFYGRVSTELEAQILVWKERTRRQMGLPPVLWLRSQNAGVPRRERHCSIYLLSAVAEECSPQMQRPQCASMEARIDGARNLQKRLAGSPAGYFRRIAAGTRKRSCR